MDPKVISRKDQLVFETHILLTTLKERVDKHSLEHHATIQNIYQEIKQIREVICEEIDEEKEARIDLDKRVTRLETEKHLGVKIMVPVFGFVFGIIGSALGSFIIKMIGQS